MADPNLTYKTGFAELVLKLGRTPTMKDAELLALHETYKKSWGPAEETVLPPTNVSAAGPSAAGFSREPAPQARTYDSDARAREGQADEPLSGPGAPEIIPEPVSEPERPVVNSGASEPVMTVASAPCRACGREFERVARRGRPPVKCEECR